MLPSFFSLAPQSQYKNKMSYLDALHLLYVYLNNFSAQMAIAGAIISQRFPQRPLHIYS